MHFYGSGDQYSHKSENKQIYSTERLPPPLPPFCHLSHLVSFEPIFHPCPSDPARLAKNLTWDKR